MNIIPKFNCKASFMYTCTELAMASSGARKQEELLQRLSQLERKVQQLQEANAKLTKEVRQLHSIMCKIMLYALAGSMSYRGADGSLAPLLPASQSGVRADASAPSARPSGGGTRAARAAARHGGAARRRGAAAPRTAAAAAAAASWRRGR